MSRVATRKLGTANPTLDSSITVESCNGTGPKRGDHACRDAAAATRALLDRLMTDLLGVGSPLADADPPPARPRVKRSRIVSAEPADRMARRLCGSDADELALGVALAVGVALALGLRLGLGLALDDLDGAGVLLAPLLVHQTLPFLPLQGMAHTALTSSLKL